MWFPGTCTAVTVSLAGGVIFSPASDLLFPGMDRMIAEEMGEMRKVLLLLDSRNLAYLLGKDISSMSSTRFRCYTQDDRMSIKGGGFHVLM